MITHIWTPAWVDERCYYFRVSCEYKYLILNLPVLMPRHTWHDGFNSFLLKPLLWVTIVCALHTWRLRFPILFRLQTNPLSVNPTKWSKTLKHFVGLALKRLTRERLLGQGTTTKMKFVFDPLRTYAPLSFNVSQYFETFVSES